MQGSGSSSSRDHSEVIKDDDDEGVTDRSPEEGSEEARHAKPATTLRTPTSEEYRIHRLTHLPYRSWCPHGVKAKKRNTGHKTISKEGKRNIPMISIDYMFMNNKVEDHANPTLVIKDHWRGGVLGLHGNQERQSDNVYHSAFCKDHLIVRISRRNHKVRPRASNQGSSKRHQGRNVEGIKAGSRRHKGIQGGR